MLFGGLADDDVRATPWRDAATTSGTAPSSTPASLSTPSGICSAEGAGHVAQEVGLGREEVLVHVEAAAFAAGEHEVALQKRRLPDARGEVRHRAHPRCGPPGLLLLEGLVEGPEVYLLQEVADLARLLSGGVEAVPLCGR